MLPLHFGPRQQKHTNFGTASMTNEAREAGTGTRVLLPRVAGREERKVPLHHLARDPGNEGLQHLTSVCPAAMDAHFHIGSPPKRAIDNLVKVISRGIQIVIEANPKIQEHTNERTAWPMWAFQQAALDFGLVELHKLFTFGFHTYTLDGSEVLVRNFPHLVSYTEGEMCSLHTDDLSEHTNNANALLNTTTWAGTKILLKVTLDGKHKYVDLGVGRYRGNKESISVIRVNDGMLVAFTEGAANQTPHLNPPCDECLLHGSMEELRAKQLTLKKFPDPCNASLMLNMSFIGPVAAMDIVIQSLDIDIVPPVGDIYVDMALASYMDTGAMLFMQVKRLLGTTPGPTVKLVSSLTEGGKWSNISGHPAASVPIMLKSGSNADAGFFCPLDSYLGVPHFSLGRRLGIDNVHGKMKFIPLTEIVDSAESTPVPSDNKTFQKGRMWFSTDRDDIFIWEDWKADDDDHLYEQGLSVLWTCPPSSQSAVDDVKEEERQKRAEEVEAGTLRRQDAQAVVDAFRERERQEKARQAEEERLALAAWLGERERHEKARQAEDERLAGTPLHTARAIDLQLVKSKVDLRGGTAIVDQKGQWNQIVFELVCIRDSREWVYSPRARMYNRCMCRQT